MIIFLENRREIADAFVTCFDREGVASLVMAEGDFHAWLDSAANDEAVSVEAILVGEYPGIRDLVRAIKSKLATPLIALMDQKSLSNTLDLFSYGFDDVISKPVHVREILVRIGVIRQRSAGRQEAGREGGIQVFPDGRDPLVAGEVLPLPRRERRVLEYFVQNQGRRVSKTQVYNFVYGLFSDEIEECVIESHISKLRKKLRYRLGFDPIDSQRYLGYCLVNETPARCAASDPLHVAEASS